MIRDNKDRISIQVGLSGYSFRLDTEGRQSYSGWMSADRVFTTSELHASYDEVEISLMTPKTTLVPEQFYTDEAGSQALGEVVTLDDQDAVESVEIPEFGAVLVYSNSVGGSLAKVIAESVRTTGGEPVRVLPEHYFMLRHLFRMTEYNKIVASYMDGRLYLVIAQGKSLMLCNSFDAVDFTTAEYFIFLALKKLQLNPEVSSISFRTPLEPEQEMSLYRYFKSVEYI